MVGVLIVSHGLLAEALITTVQSIVGRTERIGGVSVWPEDSPKELKNRIREKLRELDDGEGVLILTDMLGGTPTNISLPSLEKEEVEVVTGVNIPMLLTLSSYRRGRSLKEIGSLVKRSGRRSIILVKELLKVKK
jgi:PTS system mannose-specific IIA component